MSKKDYNHHLESAVNHTTIYLGQNKQFCNTNGQTVSFDIQSGPVAENGRNGCDATDIIRYAIGLYKSFNNAHACRENSITITKLEEALHWQEARTRDRVERNVEGTDNT